MQTPNLWCPSCGAEYRPGSLYCSTCRVALVHEPPDDVEGTNRPGRHNVDDADEVGDIGNDDGVDDEDLPTTDLTDMGRFPRLHAQILRRRLESASIPVLVEWADEPDGETVGTLLVPTEKADFAHAVITELDVEDEVPDTSPIAYVARIEEHLAAAEALLEELRTRLEDQGF